jgi:hypothetical protein
VTARERRDRGAAGMTSRHEVALLRLAAQRLAGARARTPADAVRWMTAMQAQDYAGALTSVALRTSHGARAAVEEALDAGHVVRSWPMRGTLHFVPAEDLPWLLATLAPRVVASTRGRHVRLGIEESAIEQARQLAYAALQGGRRLRRAELMAAWEAGGVSTAGQRGIHLLGHLARLGDLCLGPVEGGQQAIVLVQEWIRQPRHLEREEALGELAERYFRSHGPATAKDLQRWAGLVVADVRAGIALARPRLERLELDGVEHLLDPGTPDRLAASRREARGTYLLPGFDEMILGYADRTATLPPEHADTTVPGGNGMFLATVVHDGTAVGTWRRVGTGGRRRIEATPFTVFTDGLAADIERVAAGLP